LFKCVVKLFGLPYGLTDRNEVELELNDGAGLRDLIIALKKKIPALEGPVFYKDSDKISGQYKFNVNGRFYYEDAEEVEIKNGDDISLLTIIAGG
jgi:molybdopterin converting factor small subunit